MNRQFVYLMSGEAHTPYLLVSLVALRKVHPHTLITVYAWPESYEIVVEMANKAPDLNIRVEQRNPAYRGKNDQFLDKIALVRSLLINDRTASIVYLDADTMPIGDMSKLFGAAEFSGFTATQFCNWRISGIVRGRITALSRNADLIPYVAALLDSPSHVLKPSVNGGVFGATKDGLDWMDFWYDSTLSVAREVFIADEAVLHLIHTVEGGRLGSVLSGGEFNCSPKFQPNRTDVLNWHFHGDCNTRPDKSKRGFQLWWPVYKSLCNQNYAGVSDWASRCGNKWINNLLVKGY